MSIANFYEGDRSEYLARFVLSCLGYCIPVPRESERFLVDYLVYVHQRKKRGCWNRHLWLVRFR